MDIVYLEKAYICGPTLSSLLNSVIKVGHNVDGLLFGHFDCKSQQVFQDEDSGLISVEEHEAHLTASLCSATCCSFYNSSGELDVDRLKSLLAFREPGLDSMIGWFSYRVEAPLSPSLREGAVSRSLCASAALHTAKQLAAKTPADATATARKRLPPMLMMLISSSSNYHGGATLTLDYSSFKSGA
ncbi:hypothetical protein CEUSTIGMA_g1318.t1 [Chlamydomonas eustigma]|uniref:MPN domain-containing protein n=1 Tax=Chlamydomonas eustigma TaxID=1157962 RepID=A0A250WSQ0_9CHLO|nr:hypothetical protein CEUSTIGMA_g1318.t1 [Chlamydomonas eustigma]|eukprot:GAX73868.1 hypothetical protein CEUSTIGMA_g1318.t1 [Chlamydomonas eustigma]